MRIALITDQYHPMVGGVPIVTRRLALDLAARGNQVWVAAPNESLRNERYTEGGVTVHRWASLPWPLYEGQRLAVSPLPRLYQLFKTIKPDVAHIHSPLSLGATAPLVARRLRIPLVATNHYMPINLSRAFEGAGALDRGFTRFVYGYLRRLYSACDYVTFPTRTALNLLERHGLRTSGEALSNGIDLSRFYPGPPDERLRSALGLPGNQPLALTVTRLMREKRVDILLKALAQVPAPVHLAIAGSGPDASALQSLARELGVSQRVTFLGFVSDESLASLYRLADFFVIASVAELQSLATLEAMACGLPVLAAEAGALPELVNVDRNGYLFPADESDQLARVMVSLLRRPQRWQAMGQESFRLAAQHDSHAVVERWEAIYQRLASRPPATPVLSAVARATGA